MEVSPDIYAWLSSLNILDCIEAIKNENEEGFIVPQRTCELLVGGKYMDKVLKNLEECYSKFYKLKLNYTSSLAGLKEINEDDEYIPNSVKYFNWNLINECMNHFGLSYTDDQILKVTGGDLEMLLSILNQIYTLSNQLLKRSIDKSNANATPATNVVLPDISPIPKPNLNKSTMGKTAKTEPALDISNIGKDELNSSNVFQKAGNKSESINIATLNIKKDYEECTSPLEFFLITLCKNFEINARQAIALLSNNRKYLAILCNNGIKGSFDKVKQWIHTISVYANHLIKLLKQWPDGLPISFSTIGTALTSKDPDVTLSTAQVISRLFVDVGIDWDWLCREGFDAFIYGIIKHEEIKANLLNYFIEFVRGRRVDFMIELKKKSLAASNKKKIFMFISSILCLLRGLNEHIVDELKVFIFDLCLKEDKDKPMALSILIEAWISFFPIDDNIAASIISYGKSCIRDIHGTNISGAGIAQMFVLLKNFSEAKNQFAPNLYRVLVFLMIENYDDEIKREYFFANFEKFLFQNQTVPIDILLSPYLSLLNNKSNTYNLSDLIFIFKLLEHPRIESQHIISIITFCLKVLIHKLELARTANLILLLLFEKNFYGVCSQEDFYEIENLFIEYIKTTINLYNTSLINAEDTALLETPIDILGHKLKRVNQEVYNDVINLLYDYRKKKGKNSASVLSMLWQYDTNDDILLQLEEDFRPIYDTIEQVKIKMEEIQKEKDRKDFNKKAKTHLSQILEKKKEEALKYEMAKQNEAMKRDSLQKSMAKIRKKSSFIHGLLPSIPKTPSQNLIASFRGSDLITSTTTAPGMKTPKLLANRSITITNSNMEDAIGKAQKNFEKKKLFVKIGDGSDIPAPYNKRTKTEALDEVYTKFGIVYSVDKVKKMEEEMKRQKAEEKYMSKMQLILPEGTVIDIDKHKNNFKNSLSMMSKRARQNYKTSEVYKNFILPIDLELEEDRETKAINGYKKQYEKNIKYFFKTYGDQSNQMIYKSNILMMFREKGFTERQLTLDELSLAIHNTFDENLNELDYDEFSELLIQISFLIYTKVKDCVTISEAYGNLLRRLVPNQETEATQKLRKKMAPIIKLIKQKATNPKDDEDADFNLPPGFKIQNKTVVKYNSRLPPHFADILGEANYVCYEILEEIIFKILNSSTIEPYVKIFDTDDIVLEPEKVKNWSLKITKGFVNMGYENRTIGIGVSDCLENLLRNLCKHRDKDGNEIIPPIKRQEMEDHQSFFEQEEKKKERAEKRRKYLKKMVELYKKKKEEKVKQKEETKRKRFEKMRKEIEDFQEEARQKKEMVKQRRQEMDENKKNNLKERLEKRNQEREQKAQAAMEYLKEKKKKLKEQFAEIKLKKEEFEKQKFNSIPVNQPLPSVKEGSYKKLKKQADFEKALNETVEDLAKREDIKAVLDDYKNHIHLVYDIYSKIGYNKISFFSKEVMSLSELREFLINFTVLGLLISTDQMNWLFQKIAIPKMKDRDEQEYFDEEDFTKALIYLTMFAKFTFKSRRLVQEDVDNMNGEHLADFFKYLRFQLPYNKAELEELINERRSMSFKEILSLQREIKKEISKFNETEEDKKKEKELEEKAKKKQEERQNKIDENQANTSKTGNLNKTGAKEESKNQPSKADSKNVTGTKLNATAKNSSVKNTPSQKK